MTIDEQLARMKKHMGVSKFCPGDIVLTRNPAWKARLIRYGTQRRGESKTIVNHAGLIVDNRGTMIEALATVKKHNIVLAYEANSNRSQVAIFRPRNATPQILAAICGEAETFVGDSYGYAKIALHVADGLLGKLWIPPLFTRLAFMDDFPICSYIDAKSYAVVAWYFGVKARMATPDDIWDFVLERTDLYEYVRELAPVAAWPYVRAV